MKFIDSVKQMEGPGGTLETWLLSNGLYLYYWKDLNVYELYFRNNNQIYTKSVFECVVKKYNFTSIEYGGFFPAKITIHHKHFDKFISIVEKLDINDLNPDPFEG